VTNGGRVLGVTALGNSVAEAQAKAYKVSKSINWQNMYYRTDIGYRAVLREQSAG
jgi:phosphoribosylamine--glycine ligase